MRFDDTVEPIPVSRADHQALSDLKDRYRGNRVFVLGDGPSLNDTPLHLLANEYTFGVDRVYRLFDRIRWRPTFYTALDRGVIADGADQIDPLGGVHLLFPQRFRGMLGDSDNVTWYWEGPSLDPAQQRLATDASLGIRDVGSSIGAAIQLAFHLGFDPIYLLGCDVSDIAQHSFTQDGPDGLRNGADLFPTRDGDADRNPNVGRVIAGLQQCRDGAELAGRRILDATVGGQLDVFERVPVRSVFRRKPRPPSAEPEPQPGAAQGLSVPVRDHVAPTVLVAALLVRDPPGLVLDVGAGTGMGLAPFAAAGWEVRAFEPDPSTHDELVASLPPEWPVFVDPRALGCVETDAELFRNPFGGGCLVPGAEITEPTATVKVVTPVSAMAMLGGRKPDLVLISAAGWEQEILRAYPFDVARPDAVVLDVDNQFTTRLGFRGRDIAKELESHGYEMFALEHRRTGPNEATQVVCRVLDHEGELTHLLALPPGLASLETIDSCRRAVLAARREISATDALLPAPPGAARRTSQTDVEALRATLDAIRTSASWRIGHGIVVTAKRIVGPARRLAAAPRRASGRARARRRAS